MKKGIHPNYYKDAKVSCVCGNLFTTGSTKPEIRVDICALCHPLYTGQQKLIDTQGQVDKFSKMKAASEVKKAERVKILESRAAKITTDKKEKSSLKDLLLQARKSTS